MRLALILSDALFLTSVRKESEAPWALDPLRMCVPGTDVKAEETCSMIVFVPLSLEL